MSEQESVAVAVPVQAPRYNVNSFQVLATPTEFSILALSQVVGVRPDGQFEAGSVPAFQMGVSPAALKELVSILNDLLAQHEKELGPIVTPFLQERESSK